MAPELFQRKLNGAATDMYSLGMVLWEILTCKIPFVGMQACAIVGTVMGGGREELPDKCHPVFRSMIMACWDEKPESRPTAEQVGEQFEAALNNLKSLPMTLPPTGSRSPKPLIPGLDEKWVKGLPAELERLKIDEKKLGHGNREEKKEIKRPPLFLSSGNPPLMQGPKRPTSLKQIQLQDQLIAACKQGDEKEVTRLLKGGAKSDMTNIHGEQPLGAAVWGMCPDVVNALLKQTDGVASMTWDQCQRHNRKRYHNQIFIVSKFNPRYYSEWNLLLGKMDPNLFIRVYHLEEVAKQRHDLTTWEKLREYVQKECDLLSRLGGGGWSQPLQVVETESRYVVFRSQIQKKIETAFPSKQILTEDTPVSLKPLFEGEQLQLQNQLIEACKRGDEKAVIELLGQGAKPDMANASGEQPLGAAAWSMCPDVVEALVKKAGSIRLMNWKECRAHNLKNYKGEEFIVSKFNPQTFSEWYALLNAIEANLFLREVNLKYGWTNDWSFLKKAIENNMWTRSGSNPQSDAYYKRILHAIERDYDIYRKRIIEEIEMPTPQPSNHSQLMKLQDQLVAACKRGDEETVVSLLKKGAIPHMADTKDEPPLSAAVWGMCPGIVDVLIKKMGDLTPMTWEECVEHNLKKYHDVFMILKFNPDKFDEWSEFLKKIDSNPFLQLCHLKLVNERWRERYNESWVQKFFDWDNLKKTVENLSNRCKTPWHTMSTNNMPPKEVWEAHLGCPNRDTEQSFFNYGEQIKKTIENTDHKRMVKSSPLISKIHPVLTSSKLEIRSINRDTLHQLLILVTRGEQEEAEEMIKKNNSLLLHAGTVTDLSEREFKEITPFQYALWAMDWHMWTMIQKYLPPVAQAEQLHALETKGTGQYGKHFSLEDLMDALQTQVDNDCKWEDYHLKESTHWCKKVGGEQKRLPAHVVNEYCRSDRGFEPCPLEWQSKLPRSREVTMSERRNGSYQRFLGKGSWFESSRDGEVLGSDFAFYNCGGARAGVTGGKSSWSDLKALRSLWRTRVRQLESLKSDLSVMVDQIQRQSFGLSSSSQTLMPVPKRATSTNRIEMTESIDCNL